MEFNQEISDNISEILIGILGLQAGTIVDTDQPMTDMGLDSLSAIDLLEALQDKFGISLKPTTHVDYPTVAALAAHIEKKKSK